MLGDDCSGWPCPPPASGSGQSGAVWGWNAGPQLARIQGGEENTWPREATEKQLAQDTQAFGLGLKTWYHGGEALG